MRLLEKRCPKCDAPLQAIRQKHEVLYACHCGHAEEHHKEITTSGVLRYQKRLGARALTRIFAQPQPDSE